MAPKATRRHGGRARRSRYDSIGTDSGRASVGGHVHLFGLLLSFAQARRARPADDDDGDGIERALLSGRRVKGRLGPPPRALCATHAHHPDVSAGFETIVWDAARAGAAASSTHTHTHAPIERYTHQTLARR